MTTIDTFRKRVGRRLLGEHTEIIDVLNGDINASVTSLTITYETASVKRGSIIEIDSEQMYVISRSTNTVAVIRGWNDTTPAAHTSAAFVRVNPRFTMIDLTELIAEEINSWPVHMGVVDVQEVTFAQGEWTKELPVARDITRYLDALVQDEATSTYPQLSRVDVAIQRDGDQDEYSSGWSVTLGSTYSTARTIQITSLMEYDLSALDDITTDLETDVGVDTRYLDILVYGVMWRAMTTREIGRTSAEALPSGMPEQVPATHILQAAQALETIRTNRLSEERARLYSTWPVLMTAI